MKVTKGYVIWAEKQKEVQQSDLCLNPDDKTDPCCNPKLAMTQCCANRSGTLTMKVLNQGIQNPEVCKNYQKINVLLSDAVKALDKTAEMAS